jgi:hypothetical protein
MEIAWSAGGNALMGYSALLAKKMGIVSRVMIPCIPSGLSREMAMAAERKRNPMEKTATKRRIPRMARRVFTGDYPNKN